MHWIKRVSLARTLLSANRSKSLALSPCPPFSGFPFIRPWSPKCLSLIWKNVHYFLDLGSFHFPTAHAIVWCGGVFFICFSLLVWSRISDKSFAFVLASSFWDDDGQSRVIFVVVFLKLGCRLIWLAVWFRACAFHCTGCGWGKMMSFMYLKMVWIAISHRSSKFSDCFLICQKLTINAEISH